MAAQTLTDEVVAAAQEEAWHAEVDRQVAAFGPIGPERREPGSRGPALHWRPPGVPCSRATFASLNAPTHATSARPSPWSLAGFV